MAVLFGFADDCQVFLASPTAHLIDADNAHLAEVHGLVGFGDVMEQDCPDPLWILPQESGHLGDRHAALGKKQHHRFHQHGETGLGSRPRHGDALDTAAGTAPPAWNKGIHVTFELEESKVAPRPFIRVVDGGWLPGIRVGKSTPRGGIQIVFEPHLSTQNHLEPELCLVAASSTIEASV